MNLIRFAEVVEVPDAVAKGYLIQELNWTWNDQSWLDADAEGGTFVTVRRAGREVIGAFAETGRPITVLAIPSVTACE